MVDTPDRVAPRFPPAKEEAVRAAMKAQLTLWDVGAGDLALCGGARGADILFAELCHSFGAEVLLLLPFEPTTFLESSVRVHGSNWERRFNRLTKHCRFKMQADTLGALLEGENAHARNNAWLLATAREEAASDQNLYTLLVWDGRPAGDGPGGTSDLAARAEAHGSDRLAVINPTAIHPFARDRHLAVDQHPKRILSLDGGGVRGILTLQYLRALETLIREQCEQPDLRLCDYFDLIAGTSTGSIIAAALALGMAPREIEERYRDLASSVFRRSWRRPLGAVRAKFDDAALKGHLDGLFSDTRIGSTKLQTGLLVVTKRMDTGSQWPISNNPRARYFNARPGSTSIPNGDYPLARVVRASTAAPHFFAPEEILIHPGEKPGAFIDGGVSTANNPTLEALKLVTLESFHIGWPTGPDRLLIVSCGTGRASSRVAQSRIALFHAGLALKSIMDDCADLVETVMQWTTQSDTARVIDSDLGDLSGDLLGGEAVGTYQRYNVELDRKWILEELGKKLSERRVKKLAGMDNPKTMPQLAELGKLSAERHLKPEHLPDAFRLP